MKYYDVYFETDHGAKTGYSVFVKGSDENEAVQRITDEHLYNEPEDLGCIKAITEITQKQYAQDKNVNVIYDIDWDWDDDSIRLVLDETDSDTLAAMYDMDPAIVKDSSDDDLFDQCLDALQHNRVSVARGLKILDDDKNPVDEIEVPADWDDEAITNYISDKWGFYISGFKSSRDPEPIEQEPVLCGFVYCHGYRDFSLCETDAISAEDQAKIQEILAKYDTTGTSVRNCWDMPINQLVCDVYGGK